MAERANGGTSTVDVMSAAATRPAALPRSTRSVRSMGRSAASSRRLASSSEIVEVNGRIRTWNLGTWNLFARLLHHVSELWNHELLHREPHGGFRPWK